MWQMYVIREADTSYYKIGKAHSITSRLKQLQCGNPHKLRVIAVSDGDLESIIFPALEQYRVSGEWFDLNKSGLEKVLRLMAKFSSSRAVVEIKDKDNDDLNFMFNKK